MLKHGCKCNVKMDLGVWECGCFYLAVVITVMDLGVP
jgi:hypothetical protein